MMERGLRLVPVIPCIVAAKNDRVPVGTIVMFTSPPNTKQEYLICDGTYYPCDQYPELYAVVGDQCVPKTIKATVIRPWWKRKIFGEVNIEIDNPLYRFGHFAVPDLRSQMAGWP